MKKIWLLTILLISCLLLTWCNTTTTESNNYLIETWEVISQRIICTGSWNIEECNHYFSLCEEKAENLNSDSKFIWDWIIISWDTTTLYWMRYAVNKDWNFSSDHSVECKFDNNGIIKEAQLWEVLTLSNMKHFTKVFSGWYLYRNLRLTNELDQKEYEQLQNDRTMILDYQTKTSAVLNKFIDIINKDLLDSCKQYWRNYDSMTWTMDERNTCVDNYINGLYTKLKSELETPRSKYLWDDPVLLSYYNDLKWDHPFIRYFIDLYKKLEKKENEVSLPEYPYIWPITKNPNWWYMNDEEKWWEIAVKNWTWFYTYWAWNIGIDWIPETLDVITSIASWIVINGQMLDRIKREYWYVFPIYHDDIMYWTSPMDWPILLHIKDQYGRDFIYQILWAGAWSGEFHLIVWMLKDWIRVPVWECWTEGYVLFPRYPTLFVYDDKKWSCNGRTNYDPLTIFTQEYNLYEWNSIWDMALNFTSFLKALESTRVLSK